MKTLYLVGAVLLPALFFTMGARPSAPQIQIGAFSKADVHAPLMDGWEPLTIKKRAVTDYTLVEDSGTVVVKATSKASASGLVKRVMIAPEEYPILTWRWKVGNVLEKGDVSRKKGDDYPARLYITFDYDPSDLSLGDWIKYKVLRLLGYKDIPLRALNYIWANRAPVGTIVPNPYTHWVMMIAVQSGSEHIKTWQVEVRNIYEDYEAAFGEKPGRITGIALMTDTDNTGESATAYYGDISLCRADSSTRRRKP